jgi:hypothetical protein
MQLPANNIPTAVKNKNELQNRIEQRGIDKPDIEMLLAYSYL